MEFQLGFPKKGTRREMRLVIGLLMAKPMEDLQEGTEPSLDHDVGDRKRKKGPHRRI